MRTVGEILKNTRIEKKLTLEEIERITRIRVCYLEALEKNDFAKIPGGAPISKGFIKNYAQFLGLSSQELLAIFRRDFRESKTGQIILRGMVEPLGREGIIWTPKMTLIFGVVFLFLVLGGYLFYQYFLFLGSPPLTISQPLEQEVIKESLVRVIGKTDSDATLFLNGEIKSIADDGSFKEEVFLSPGENKILIEAVSRRGKKTKIVRQLRYEP